MNDKEMEVRYVSWNGQGCYIVSERSLGTDLQGLKLR